MKTIVKIMIVVAGTVILGLIIMSMAGCSKNEPNPECVEFSVAEVEFSVAEVEFSVAEAETTLTNLEAETTLTNLEAETTLTNLVICADNWMIELSMTEDGLSVTGDLEYMDEAAEQFFNQYLKEICDDYIRNRTLKLVPND